MTQETRPRWTQAGFPFSAVSALNGGCQFHIGRRAVTHAPSGHQFDGTPQDGSSWAQLLIKKIVGWFQGRSELGPRALGNRSILADPRDEAMKDRINARVKHREPFRPFAPAILQERAAEFFEIEQIDPFMTMAPKVRPDKAALIPAGIHVDGTARIQTVDRSTNPRFYGVIEKFAELTGVPVVLNTSFNLQEPIVQSPENAISCYLRTQMDVLVVGDFYVTDRTLSQP